MVTAKVGTLLQGFKWLCHTFSRWNLKDRDDRYMNIATFDEDSFPDSI